MFTKILREFLQFSYHVKKIQSFLQKHSKCIQFFFSKKNIIFHFVMAEDPLYQVACAYACETNAEADDRVKEIIFSALNQYINNQIAYEECVRAFAENGCNQQAADRVRQILNTQESTNATYTKKKSFNNVRNGRKIAQNWTPNEDNKLLCALHKFGLNNWERVSEFVGLNRNKYQCSQRWYRVLDPSIKKGFWTADEEKELLKLVEKYGDRSWKQIAAEMKYRTDTQCRYHYAILAKKIEPTKKSEETFGESSPSPFDSPLSNPAIESKNIITKPQQQTQQTVNTKQQNIDHIFSKTFDKLFMQESQEDESLAALIPDFDWTHVFSNDFLLGF